MGWVVKSWRIEALTELVGAAPARELADADAYLAALEQLGLETRDQVARQRRRLRPERVVAPAPPALVGSRDATRPLRRCRATLHDSPLPALFAAAGRRA